MLWCLSLKQQFGALSLEYLHCIRYLQYFYITVHICIFAFIALPLLVGRQSLYQCCSIHPNSLTVGDLA